MWNNKGKCRLVPKFKGYEIIIQAFQYRYFVLGYPLTVTNIQTINRYLSLRPKYVDTYAETAILRHNHKEPITVGRNIFFREFEYGESSEVYWTYNRVVLQIEDFTKILKALNPGIDLIFLFDHPCGSGRSL